MKSGTARTPLRLRRPGFRCVPLGDPLQRLMQLLEVQRLVEIRVYQPRVNCQFIQLKRRYEKYHGIRLGRPHATRYRKPVDIREVIVQQDNIKP